MYPHWRRREDLDGEICSIMGRSDLIVFEDAPHSCIHIMIGDYEFTSALFPLDDAIRNDLRQQAFLLQNGTNEDEVERIRDANEKREKYGEAQLEEAKAGVREKGTWEYKHRFLGKEITPMIVLDGGEQ